jgi:hypothetical protein
MNLFIQFYTLEGSAGPKPGDWAVQYVVAVGHKSTIDVDGGMPRNEVLKLGATEMEKRGYKAFQLFNGHQAISTLYKE